MFFAYTHTSAIYIFIIHSHLGGQVLFFAFTHTNAIHTDALGKKQDLTLLTIDLLVAFQAATNVKW